MEHSGRKRMIVVSVVLAVCLLLWVGYCNLGKEDQGGAGLIPRDAALVMAIDAQLLVLDEPTLGLDIQFRRQFYEQLLNDYYDEGRTIIVSTHQVDEIEPKGLQ